MSDYRNPSPAALGSALTAWHGEVVGRHAAAWEQQEFDRLVADAFGYHAVQVGLTGIQTLRMNRMPSRWTITDPALDLPDVGGDGALASVQAEFHALPFASSSLDLVALPHTLEVAADPHQTLREVERVLRPEGRVVISGFNPASLWGLSHRWRSPRAQLEPPARLATAEQDWVGYWRLRDWLRLLSFEIEGSRFGCYIPPVRTERWRDRWQWMEGIGDRWWPVLGGVYVLSAVKRVRGMRMVGLAKTAKRTSSARAAARAGVTRNRQGLPPEEQA